MQQLPIVWSDWTLEVLERVFSVLEHAQPEVSSNNHGSSSGGDSSEQSASFLMNANCMFTPMFRTLLIRLPEDSRKLAIRRIAGSFSKYLTVGDSGIRHFSFFGVHRVAERNYK